MCSSGVWYSIIRTISVIRRYRTVQNCDGNSCDNSVDIVTCTNDARFYSFMVQLHVRMDKTTIQSILLWFHLSILISYSSCWFSLSHLFIIMCFCFVNIISSFQNSMLIGWFPSKSIKVWRKIGWSSIPSKLVKVFDQRFLWPLSLSKFHQKLCQRKLW